MSICLVRTRNGICSKAIPHRTKGGSIGGNNVPPKKKEFLGQIDRIAPWGEWVAKIKPWDYKGERGVDSSNQVPDGDTLGRFCHIFEENGIQQKRFAQMVRNKTNRRPSQSKKNQVQTNPSRTRYAGLRFGLRTENIQNEATRQAAVSVLSLTAAFFTAVSENHRLCRWFQKALAMRKKLSSFGRMVEVCQPPQEPKEESSPDET